MFLSYPPDFLRKMSESPVEIPEATVPSRLTMSPLKVTTAPAAI